MRGGAPTPAAGRRRFIAPARADVDPTRFAHPLFAAFADFNDVLVAPDFPGVAALDQRLGVPGKRLVAQDEDLLADGLHYERRIAAGCIATRAENWHDLFNALVWARYPAIKQALNARQCRDLDGEGSVGRTRAQAALTQFDETGVVVRVRDAALVHAWDRHAWDEVFPQGAEHWCSGTIAVAAVFGHALMEQALLPSRLLVGKCLVVQGDDDAQAVEQVARAIALGDVLNDPLELRPLPLMGIPGWHSDQDEAFYRNAEYFRPVREGREYPGPHGISR
ncbi:DUF3025 domain-containing protein [Stenotrophomonas sp. PD6]|uniref:DUF3025 domain-containing protein n=1 Tax=Stenotrophomonas sp. PD6 TaxID=3368612 RepID=UPI003B9EBBEF